MSDGPVSRRSTCAAGGSCGCTQATTTRETRTTTTIRSRSRAAFDAAGARWIHVVDLDAARDGGDREPRRDRGDLRERRRCASQTGGGVRSVDDAGDRFAAGVAPRRDRQRGGRAPGARRRARRAASRARSRSGSTPAAATSRSTVGPRRPALDLVALAARFDRSRASARSSSPTSTATACSAGPTLEQLAAVLARDGGPGHRERRRRQRSTTCARSRRSRSTAGGLTGAIVGTRDLRGPLHRRGRDRRVLAVRVIPCLDVDAGRVVKGVRFVEIRDAGDPVELAARYDAEGADELVFLDITASSRRPRHDGARRRARRRAGVHPVHRRRRDPHASKTCGGCCAPAPTRCRSTPRRSTTPISCARGADEFGNQCIVVAIDARRRNADDPGAGWEVVTHGGRTADRARRGRVGGARVRARRRRDPAHVDGPRRHEGRLRPRAAAGGRRGGRRAGHRERRRRHARAPLRRARPRAGRRGLLAASIFHFGQYTVREAKAALAAHGLTVRP